MTWLEDHKVNDTTIYPAAGMLAMVIEAAKELSEDFEQNITGYEIRDAVFHTPLVFPEATRVRETQISLRPISTAQIGENEWYDYRLYASKTDGEWEEICRGSVCVATEQLEVDFDDEFRKQLHQLEGNISASMASCQNQIAPELLYKGLKAIGLDLGPSLQLLDQIRFNNTGKAVATVKKSILSNATTAESKQTPVQDCVIHPTSLDSILQLVFVAWTRGGLDAAHVMIPTRIDKMKISGITNAISCSGPFTVCAQSNDVQEHHSLCTVSALSQDNHSVIIQGAEFTTISDRQTTLQKKNENFHLCYSMDWNVDLDTMSGTEILEHCSKAVTTDGKPIKWYQDIELMALTFGANVLDTLKHSNQVVLPSMRKYVAWIQELVDRQLAPLDPNDRDARRLEAVDFGQSTCIPSKMEDNIIEEVFINVGKSLQDILVGDLDPLRIIYGDEDRIRGFYQQINEESHVFDAFSVYLGALLHKTSGMNILEIGGGTAATTELLHKTLSPMSDPRYSKYHFTDISPSLLDKAKIVLQRYERVKFDILDIEKDPMTQGFQKESYDLIVASQVFHATKNLEETIRHARSLLKPGGKLILVELTTQRALPGFVFGLLPGWWRGIEPYRQKSPCISESMWNELLTINGFSGSDVVFRDYENDECHIWSLIVATAMSPAWSQLHDLVLIIDKKSYPQQELAREVGRKLQLMKVPRIETMDLEEASKLDFERDVHVAFLSDLLSPILQGIKSQPFQRLKTILLSARTFLWVTKGGEQSDHAPAHGMVQGLCRVIRQESPHVALSVLSIERAVTTDKIRQANAIAKVLQRSASTFGTEQFEPEYFEVDGLLHINRLTEARVANEYIKSTSTPQARLQKFGQGPSLKLEPKNLGLISSLHFVQDEVNTPLGPTEIEVHVQAVGVNFRDCLATLGRLKDSTLGFECAGTVSRVGEKCQIMVPGDRVVLCATGCYKTMVRGESQCAIIIPPTMSFSEAASFPICFGTAYYCLVNIANIQPGESVLIHSASGGTGQAALQIALLLRAEVFVTVGSDTKKRLLMDTYNLPEDRIFYSRNTSFASGVKRMTGNRGVDVVINSLSGRRLLASWECVAPFGHFLELGKADIDAHNSLPLHPFGNNASFTGVDFTTIFQQRPTTVQTILSEIFTLALTKRIRPPHPLQLSSIQEVEKVFRTLQSGNSSGKFVLETMKSAMVPVS
jgi:NADPH:quinone reductase-like Zn-dependent oxidoreductase/SAM-dependent methyltransferase